MPYLTLPSSHYASGWSQDREIRNIKDVTEVGVRYVNQTDPKKKEALLLELVGYFHSYIFKYVSMIVSGTIPKAGAHINPDAKILLRFFLPKGESGNGFALAKVARNLQLAFKGMEVEEVYNILAGCLIRAIQKYDPTYTAKVRQVVNAIDELVTPLTPSFTGRMVTDKAGFQASHICKMLVRRGHLVRFDDPNNPKMKYLGKAQWPPDEALLNATIDLTYFVPFYFRHYLQQHITQQMRAIESRTMMVQLEQRQPLSNRNCGFKSLGGSGELRIPSIEGNLVDANGRRWLADTELMNQDQDLGSMNLAWVNDCTDLVFSRLEKRDRLFLFLQYAKEMTKQQICQAVGIKPKDFESFHASILAKCRDLTLKKAS